jgi:hypothetical protein
MAHDDNACDFGVCHCVESMKRSVACKLSSDLTLPNPPCVKPAGGGGGLSEGSVISRVTYS